MGVFRKGSYFQVLGELESGELRDFETRRKFGYFIIGEENKLEKG